MFPPKRTLPLLKAILGRVQTFHAVTEENRAIFGVDRILARDSQINGEISTRFDSELIAKNLVNTLNGIRVLERTGASARQMRMIVDMALDAIKS